MCSLNLLVVVFVLWFHQIYSIIVKKWHEECLHDDECSDHRQICNYIEENKPKRCICDRIHNWSIELTACIPIHNSTSLINLLQEKYNTTGWIAEEAKIIFLGASIAGLIVVVIGLLCFLSVVLYCMHIRRRDRALKGIVQSLKEQKSSDFRHKSNV